MEKGTLQMTSYALVTGASRNIGRAIAERLTDDGYTVLMLDKRVPEGPCPGEFRQVDLSDAAATTEALQWALDGRNVTRLVNCAGIAPAARVVGRDGPMPLEAFDHVIQVNLVGTFNLIRLAAVLFRRERGVIVNTASVSAFEGQILSLIHI